MMNSIYYRIRKWHRRNLTKGHYPGSMMSAGIFLSLVNLAYFYGLDLTVGLTSFFQGLLNTNIDSRLASCSMAGFIMWFLVAWGRKLILRSLLKYRGWMYERNKPTLRTKLVIFSIKLLSGWLKPITKKLYGLQGVLPSLPVPSIQQSVSRYLDSMRPLVDDDRFSHLKILADEFKQGLGSKLQRYLVLKSWLSANYISDWWEDYVYLMGRSPILINSNYYILDVINQKRGAQAARAASLSFEALMFRESIENNTLEPLVGQDVIPLCSWQYERFFNTSRIPGETIDFIQHVEHSNHIAVYCRGKYFYVPIRHNHNGKLLTLPELQVQFLRVLHDSSAPAVGEEKLAALTAWDRTRWARTRSQFFSQGVNRQSLDVIEKAAFVVTLDEEEYSSDLNGVNDGHFDKFSQAMFHGNGSNRWCDKSFNIIVGKNGIAGLNNEHTWADAPVVAQFWEVALIRSSAFHEYDENGLISTPLEALPPSPQRLVWQLPSGCLEAIETAAKCAEDLIKDSDLTILTHCEFGKGFMKKCKVSPDGCIQMALQLAYYRHQGRFDLTYEASMTRLYKLGRTETVRPCTTESCDWVLSMVNDAPREEKLRLLMAALERHQNSCRNALCGKGFDRHLFGLYVVSKYLKLDSPFLKEALSEPWRLTTSQTPQWQTKLAKSPDLISVGGGFGPAADNGYGVSYAVAGEDAIFFHISSKKTCSTTSSKRFAEEIRRALDDLRILFTGDNNNCGNGKVEEDKSLSSKEVS